MGAPTPSRRRALSASEDRRWARARRQLAIAKLAAQHLGGPTAARGEGRTAADVQLLVEHEMREGRIALGSVPCRNTLAALAERYRAGARSFEDYVERPRSGRPRTALDPSLVAFLEDAVDRAVYRTVARLHGALVAEAKRLGVEEPTYHKVKAEYARLNVARHAAARHGSAAAKFDALPHSTVPAEATNEVWTLDEVKLPLWARMWCRKSGMFVSIAVWLVLVQEYLSRAVVGWHLVYPGRRLRADDMQMRDGYDSADVLAALMNAAVPALAPPSTRRFAGRAPDVIRMDRHSTHGTAARARDAASAAGAPGAGDAGTGAADSEPGAAPDGAAPDEAAPDEAAWDDGLDLGGDLVEELAGVPRARWAERLARIHGEVFDRLRVLGSGDRGGIRIPEMPGQSPDNRGVLEALNKFVQALCEGVDGHRDQVLPRDRLPKSIPADLSPEALAAALGRLRTATSARGTRVPRLVLVDPANLPSVDELRSFFDRRLSAYNHEHVHPAHGTTPVNAYFEHLRRNGRPGTDLVRALRPETHLVEKRGIVHRVDRREFVFAPDADGWMATLGTPVTYRPDPLLRALFAEVHGRMVVLKPLPTYASDLGDKAQAQRQRAAAFAYSHAARAAREATLPPGAWGLDTARGPAAPPPATPEHPLATPRDAGDLGAASPLDGSPGTPSPTSHATPSATPGAPRTPDADLLATADFRNDPLFPGPAR